MKVLKSLTRIHDAGVREVSDLEKKTCISQSAARKISQCTGRTASSEVGRDLSAEFGTERKVNTRRRSHTVCNEDAMDSSAVRK